MKRGFFLFTFLLLAALPFWAQPVSGDEQLSFVGMTLQELIQRFGAPNTVIAARGSENWQDDVIFQYEQADFYIYKDRVWQVGLASISGISNKERKPSILLALGDAAQDMGDHILFPVSGKDWPLTIRINFGSSGQVSAIYVYRSDF